MNTEYAVGNIRMRFESRARRRWFVALIYTVLAVFFLAVLLLNTEEAAGAWVRVGCFILFARPIMLFMWLAG